MKAACVLARLDAANDVWEVEPDLDTAEVGALVQVGIALGLLPVITKIECDPVWLA